MAMFNMEAIARQREQVSQRSYDSFGGNRGGSRTFRKIRMKALGTGNYRVRILPPMPVKNPTGAFLVSTHTIEHDSHQGTPDTSVLAPESIANPEEQCHLITRLLDTIEQYGAYEKIPSKAIRRVIDKLKPWRRYWIPVLILATEIPPPEGKDEKEKYVPASGEDAKWLDRVLEIDFTTKLPGKIFDLLGAEQAAGRTPLSMDEGSDFVLTLARNSHDIKIVPGIRPLDAATQKFVIDEYPDLVDRARHWNFKEPDEIIAMVNSSWWAESFKEMGFKLTEPRQQPRIVPDGSEG